jgi:pimeloyl-ACP methyl ester carboxylesterase
VEEKLQIRIHGEPALPTLIYLPGLHGDWTLGGNFRRQLAGKVRFVEFAYPRALTRSLDDYAAAVEQALKENGIACGWLLGESFGSQILWPLVRRGNFPIQGIILAGGFTKHPLRGLVRLAEKLLGQIPFTGLVWAMYSFTKCARFYFRHSPERLAELEEFVTRRTRLDSQAATHRLHLIPHNDPRPIAASTHLRVFYITGIFDPIVQWPLVRSWLKQNCRAFREARIIGMADHNVLGTGSRDASRQIVDWLSR